MKTFTKKLMLWEQPALPDEMAKSYDHASHQNDACGAKTSSISITGNESVFEKIPARRYKPKQGTAFLLNLCREIGVHPATVPVYKAIDKRQFDGILHLTMAEAYGTAEIESPNSESVNDLRGDIRVNTHVVIKGQQAGYNMNRYKRMAQGTVRLKIARMAARGVDLTTLPENILRYAELHETVYLLRDLASGLEHGRIVSFNSFRSGLDYKVTVGGMYGPKSNYYFKSYHIKEGNAIDSSQKPR